MEGVQTVRCVTDTANAIEGGRHPSFEVVSHEYPRIPPPSFESGTSDGTR